jgi:dTDP-glucose pyrophosphorylase
MCPEPEPGPPGAPTRKAVVLAAGRGSRLRESTMAAVPAGVGERGLDPEQRWAAERGLKPLVPFHGAPFLAYGLAALARAGIREVCLVVRPDAGGSGEDPIRSWARGAAAGEGRSLRVDFAVQPRPEGSARALLSAERWVGDDSFLLVNADNLYPPEVLEGVGRLPGCGLAGFRSSGLLSGGRIPRGRIASFALLEVDGGGCLRNVVEKPDPEARAGFGPDPLVSMNCWRFTPGIFEACRSVPVSARGEYELPAAVLGRIRSGGGCVTVLPVDAEVLDLTEREDIARVEDALRGRGPSW